jgi:hypothetical protein
MNNDALAASTRQGILNESCKLGISHELLTRRYVFERFLARLAHSALRDRLVLRGAMALVAVTKSFGYATRDMDMLGLDKLTAAQALDAIRTIATTEPGDADAISFDPMSFSAVEINQAYEEPGHQISGVAKVGSMQVPLKIEIVHGNVVSPAVLDGTASPEILCYTPETMLAEKFEAIVSLGTGTSRFKDFYDVRELSRKVRFVGVAVAEAFRATFSQRGTELPTVVPESFLPGFAQTGETGWKHFLRKLATTDAQSFAEMVAEIEPFVMKISAMARRDESEIDWMPGRGWSLPGPGIP